jgi:two-component system, OmpR family, sensor kinase
MVWLLGALALGAPLVIVAAYFLTLGEIDEVLDDSLRQSALLLADRDLASGLPAGPALAPSLPADPESVLVAIARRSDGTLLFSSRPELSLQFRAAPGLTVQHANHETWHVYTVVQPDRVIQVAQPMAVRREVAAESASAFLLPLSVLFVVIAGLLVMALRRGLHSLQATSDELARLGAGSLSALDVQRVPREILPLVRTLNDLLLRLARAFEAQRNFVADAAHELRTPITALQLQLQVMERSRDPAERAEAGKALAAGIGRARRLTEQLLYLSRAAADDADGSPLPDRAVRLDDLARGVVARWSAEAERRQIDLGADTRAAVVVRADADQIEVMLSNLVDNALKYTPRGGVVDVVVDAADGVPRLRVVDDGPGIAESERARVFDRFYRSPAAIAGEEGGSGLGLAIVRLIARRHGAEVTLHAGVGGRGLEVRVAFPVAGPRQDAQH